mmetsp:Transcript_10189/g.17723  ORF Transcript_10189/g.17723 Transcript_10189/m.17723 type:complete len:201 (+) Transcript_10189:40-642(+)
MRFREQSRSTSLRSQRKRRRKPRSPDRAPAHRSVVAVPWRAPGRRATPPCTLPPTPSRASPARARASRGGALSCTDRTRPARRPRGRECPRTAGTRARRPASGAARSGARPWRGSPICACPAGRRARSSSCSSPRTRSGPAPRCCTGCAPRTSRSRRARPAACARSSRRVRSQWSAARSAPRAASWPCRSPTLSSAARAA